MYQMRLLERNAPVVMRNLVTQEDGPVFTRADLSILLPKKFLGTPLLNIENENPKLVGKFMILVGKRYSVADFPAVITLGKCSRINVLVDGVECFEFQFDAGDMVFTTWDVPVDTNNIYHLTHVVHKLGAQIPWITEEEFERFLDSSPEFANMWLPHYAYTNIYSSYLSRVKGKPQEQYRLAGPKAEYVNIPLDSVILAVSNTLNVLGGNYLEDGIQSKLLTPSQQTTAMEEVLL